jgi:hypothetical protein
VSDTRASRVWLAPCLCPARPGILAAAGEDVSAEEARALCTTLQETVTAMRSHREINPSCDRCQSRDWHDEGAPTPSRTMDEARPPLEATARAHRETHRRITQDRHEGEAP